MNESSQNPMNSFSSSLRSLAREGRKRDGFSGLTIVSKNHSQLRRGTNSELPSGVRRSRTRISFLFAMQLTDANRVIQRLFFGSDMKYSAVVDAHFNHPAGRWDPK